ncbi:hypothetical protein PYCC9005_005068 [Savitreella phatthalungensis]
MPAVLVQTGDTVGSKSAGSWVAARQFAGIPSTPSSARSFSLTSPPASGSGTSEISAQRVRIALARKLDALDSTAAADNINRDNLLKELRDLRSLLSTPESMSPSPSPVAKSRHMRNYSLPRNLGKSPTSQALQVEAELDAIRARRRSKPGQTRSISPVKQQLFDRRVTSLSTDTTSGKSLMKADVAEDTADGDEEASFRRLSALLETSLSDARSALASSGSERVHSENGDRKAIPDEIDKTRIDSALDLHDLSRPMTPVTVSTSLLSEVYSTPEQSLPDARMLDQPQLPPRAPLVREQTTSDVLEAAQALRDHADTDDSLRKLLESFEASVLASMHNDTQTLTSPPAESWLDDLLPSKLMLVSVIVGLLALMLNFCSLRACAT